MTRTARRSFLARLAAAGAAIGCRSAFGQNPAAQSQPTDRSAPDLLIPAAEQAIERGLAWLARRQVQSGRDEGAFGHGGYQGGVAVASLGGLAFMASGSAPAQGPYGRAIDRCVRYVASCVQESGYIAVPGTGQDNMYGHGFGMLFLSQAYGMSARPEDDRQLGEQLRSAVRLTCQCQNAEGGWRYQPVRSDADLSVTISQIMGLRAARDAGIHVPDDVRTRCIDYVKRSQNRDGGFRYQLEGGQSTFPLTAAGVVSLYSAGIYEGESVTKALAWLMSHLPGRRPSNTSYFYYGHYYAVQAMWHAGGDYFQRWFPAIRDLLLGRQAPDGSWPDQEVCPEFGTAMTLIILQMPNNFVPIFAP